MMTVLASHCTFAVTSTHRLYPFNPPTNSSNLEEDEHVRRPQQAGLRPNLALGTAPLREHGEERHLCMYTHTCARVCEGTCMCKHVYPYTWEPLSLSQRL